MKLKKYIQDIITMSVYDGMTLTTTGHLLVKIAIDKNGIYKVAVPRIDDRNRHQYDILKNLEEVKDSEFFEEIIYDKITGNPVYVEFNMSKK